MAKEKVYKLAQEFKVSSEALVQMLRGMGISVKSHMSTVDESLRDAIKKKFEQERAEIKKEYERKKQMLTRAREELIGKGEEEGGQTVSAATAVETASSPSTHEFTATDNRSHPDDQAEKFRQSRHATFRERRSTSGTAAAARCTRCGRG